MRKIIKKSQVNAEVFIEIFYYIIRYDSRARIKNEIKIMIKDE